MHFVCQDGRFYPARCNFSHELRFSSPQFLGWLPRSAFSRPEASAKAGARAKAAGTDLATE